MVKMHVCSSNYGYFILIPPPNLSDYLSIYQGDIVTSELVTYFSLIGEGGPMRQWFM